VKTLPDSSYHRIFRIVRPLLSRALHGFRAWLETLPYVFVSVDLLRPMVVVTGSDSSHFLSLCQFLASVRRHEPKLRTVAFDFGLTDAERQHLSSEFPDVDLRRFDFSAYPDYFNIKVKAGEYAWKPVIVSDIMNEFHCDVCWMDAGNMLSGPLITLRKVISRLGMYSPASAGTVGDWTHPGTLHYLNAPASITAEHNLNGACVAVSWDHPQARQLIDQWRDCALVHDCIAPPGSSRINHRQDQAVLSVLAHQSGLARHMPKALHGFLIHQDID
jgi:hypothetical protein